MGGNGDGLGPKPICQLLVNADGKLIINTGIKNMITLAKWLSNALHAVVRQIPEGEEKKIVEVRPKILL